MFDEKTVSRMGMGRPTSVHLDERPYDRNSPIVARSLSSCSRRPVTANLELLNEKKMYLNRMRLQSFSESANRKSEAKRRELENGYQREEKYKTWRTRQLLGTIKPPKTESDKQVIERIKFNALNGNARKSVILPDDDGDYFVERDFQFDGKPKIVYSHKLPRETKAIHKQIERVYYWG